MCRNRTLTTMRLEHAEVRRGSLCISTRFHRINVTSHIPTSYRKLKIRCNNPFRSHTQHHMHSRTMGYTNFRRKLCHCLCTFPPKRNCRHDTSSYYSTVPVAPKFLRPPLGVHLAFFCPTQNYLALTIHPYSTGMTPGAAGNFPCHD